MCSPRSALSLPLSKHGEQESPVRVPSIDEPRGHRCIGQAGRFRGDQLLATNRDYPVVPSHHGDRKRAVKDGASWGRVEEDAYFFCAREKRPRGQSLMRWNKILASRQVATFIVQKILLDEMGLNYICATAERFYAVRGRAQSLLLLLLRLLSLISLLNCTLQVSTVLSNMVAVLVDQPSVRLLKHIVRCYLRLSDNLR